MTRRWLKERRSDHYYKLAKKENLRSRAAFKLKQLNEKYKIIKRGYRVLDIGSAPGGWLLSIKEIVGDKGVIVGVDIQPISEIEGVHFILGDITDSGVIEKITKVSSEFDTVTSDCSPNVSGNWELDHARQLYLSEKSLETAIKVLVKGGSFIVKVFQGELFREFIDKMRKYFSKVIITKPEASRRESSEVYVIGLAFRGERT
ncbi:MAG: RlmE family RNA methyltransferase [Candidatus Odinarchaeum yellowstonii]|uniref:Ribosomal RNA large subunit methyltransferase E n=1 Tax=Odinarchaeota yellowstonii (strain LCB_4) TaxID=1841599 RepID=A0AAF0D4C4_ODILC|nr:MAG: RlmE family RNA methyltransferase [Candidatus Odinarchaeum yellowstonii]